MASSFIDFKGKGFWIRDNILNLTLCFLYTKMSESILPSWAIEFGDLIKENATGEFYGFVDLELDRFLISVERRQFFIGLLDETTETLSNGGSNLHITEFYKRTSDFFGLGDINVEISRLIKVIEYLKGLVKGEITTVESDPIDYFF